MRPFPPERQRALLRALAGRKARRWGVALSLVAAAVLVPGLLRLRSDNSPRVFFVQGSPGVEEYRSFVDRFGSDKLVRLVVEGPGLWSAEGLSRLRVLEEGVAAARGVSAVSGVFTHTVLDVRRGGRSAGLEWPPSNPDAFRRRMLSDPLARDLGWVGRDGETITVLITVAAADNRSRAEVLSRLGGALERALEGTDGEVSAHLEGELVLDRALDRSTRAIGRRSFPWLAVLAVLLLAVSFRNVAAVGVPLILVALVELAVMGPMGWIGVELNLVLAVLPPLLFVIALATGVHLLVRCRDFEEEGSSSAEAVVLTYRDKGWAVLWTGVSTLVGFSSLAVSRVGPVHTLGLWAGLGIGAMIVLAFVLYPALLSVALLAGARGSERRRPFERWLRRAGRRWAEWAARRKFWVLGLTVVSALFALAGLPRLRLETNALHYLRPDHPARMAIESLEERGIGTSTVELMLTVPEEPDGAGSTEPAGFDNLDAFRRLANLTHRLRDEPQVLGAVSAGDLLEDAVRRAPGGAFFGAATARRVAFDRLVGGERPMALDHLLTHDGRSARVTLFTRTAGTAEIDPLLERAPEIAREVFPQARAVATGELPLMLESQHYLMSTLTLSLSITVLAIAAIFRLLLPSTRLTLFALVPNLWPVLGVVGLMGWLGIPLDVATVMVAAVVLGLAVDDTIHTLGHFRELAPRQGRFEAVAGTLERTAPSYVLTGLILGAGFGVCALSDFAPTSRFGVLSAIAIVLAVLGDLFLVPALLGSTPHSVVRRLGGGRGG